MNLYQYAKNQAFLSFFSRDIADLKILEYDWLRAFWRISQQPNFSQIWYLSKNTAINFLYRPNSEKKWLNFSINLKNSTFGTFLGQFFFKNSRSVTHNSTWTSNTMLRFKEKLMSQSHKNFGMEEQRDEKTEEWKYRQALIHRTPLATPGGPKIT